MAKNRLATLESNQMEVDNSHRKFLFLFPPRSNASFFFFFFFRETCQLTGCFRYEGWNRSPLIPRDYSTLKRKTVERRSIQKGQRFDSADWAMKVKETPSEQKTSLPKHLKN